VETLPSLPAGRREGRVFFPLILVFCMLPFISEKQGSKEMVGWLMGENYGVSLF
jgi:hypothetical protein